MHEPTNVVHSIEAEGANENVTYPDLPKDLLNVFKHKSDFIN